MSRRIEAVTDSRRSTKVVGRRPVEGEGGVPTPEEAFRRAVVLQQSVEAIHPHPRPRWFVHKAGTWRQYEEWRASQENPRLW